MSEHTLKTWPVYFDALWSGEKKFEVRKNDRNFQVRDTLRLRDYDPETDTYSGDEIVAEVTYRMKGGRMGIAEGYCVMSLRLIETINPNGGREVSEQDLETQLRKNVQYWIQREKDRAGELDDKLQDTKSAFDKLCLHFAELEKRHAALFEALEHIQPFAEVDYHASCATREFQAAIEHMQRAIKENGPLPPRFP